MVNSYEYFTMKVKFISPEAIRTEPDLILTRDYDPEDFAWEVHDLVLSMQELDKALIALLPPVPPGVSIPGIFKKICKTLAEFKHKDVKISFVVTDSVRGHLMREVPESLRTQDMMHHKDFPFGSLQVSLRLGDLVRSQAEAIVNASNPDLKLGGGVSGAIREAAGLGLQTELLAIADSQKIEDGDAIITGSYGLPGIRWIIHAASVRATSEVVGACIRNSLSLCVRNRIQSVAFPALGTGVGGLSMAQCAATFVREISRHSQTNALPENIMILLWIPEDWTVFVENFSQAAGNIDKTPGKDIAR